MEHEADKIDWKLFEISCINLGINPKNQDGTYRKLTYDLLDEIAEVWHKSKKKWWEFWK